MLLLYLLWDDWPIFMISTANEQLQQQLECTLLKLDCHSWWIFKMQSGHEDTLEEWYAIKFCFLLGKNAREMYGMLQTAFRPSCINRASVFEWHKRFKEGREFVWGMIRGVGGVRKSIHQSWLAKGLWLGLQCWGLREFMKRFRQKRPALFKSDQWHFHQDNAPVHNSILVTDYLTKMCIKTVSQPSYSANLTLCDFWLFPKLRGCHYETIEEVKGAVTKVIDMLIQEEFHGTFQKLLKWYNKCIGAGGEYFEGDKSFMCVLSIKVLIRKMSGNLFHHHHHIVLAARISLTLSRHSSLSFIALGRSSGQQPVSSHSCWMYVRAGRPAFARPCVGIHKSTSLMSSSLLLQQCPACLVRLTWIVFVIGGRWPYSWCLVGCCCQDLFRIATQHSCVIAI